MASRAPASIAERSYSAIEVTARPAFACEFGYASRVLWTGPGRDECMSERGRAELLRPALPVRVWPDPPRKPLEFRNAESAAIARPRAGQGRAVLQLRCHRSRRSRLCSSINARSSTESDASMAIIALGLKPSTKVKRKRASMRS